MIDVSQPSLPPDTIARIADLEVRARRVVDSVLSGRHRSPRLGPNVEFAKRREYTPGDDPRHLDWKAWAKSDRLLVKQFEAETSLQATLVVDTSESMRYGEPASKLDHARILVGSLAYLLLRQLDAVGLLTFAETIQELPARRTLANLWPLLATLEATPISPATRFHQAILALAERLNFPGLVVLVSDLLVDANEFRTGLAALAKRRHDVIVLHLAHADERDFPFEGTTCFEGMEDATRLVCDPKSLRSAYCKAFDEHCAAIRAACATFHAEYHFACANDPPEIVLSGLLRGRLRL